MTRPIDFFWFIPTSGDGSYLGSADLNRAPDHGYLREIAVAVDRLGYKGVLLPTGAACEESFVTAAALAPVTQKLRTFERCGCRWNATASMIGIGSPHSPSR